MKRVVKTKRQDIVAYWKTRVYEGDMGVDWSEASFRCWRCADRRVKMLQRCHIIPEQEPFNGKDEPANMVLLCARCHVEAPSCDDPQEMWRWIKRTCKPTYGDFWADRAIDSIEREIGPLAGFFKGVDLTAFTKLYAKNIERCGYHGFGAESFSNASKTWVIKTTKESLLAVVQRSIPQ